MCIVFLDMRVVLAVHANQVALYGGDPGVRDQGLLESAIAQPMAAFGGHRLHGDVFDMAAAYLYHIVQNHPFIDGNKRAGAMAALVFLAYNDVRIKAQPGAVYTMTMGVAQGHLGKSDVASFFRTHAK